MTAPAPATPASVLGRLVNRLRLTGAYLGGRAEAGGWPMELTLELTNRCDLACVMCPRNWAGRPLGDMSLALFREVVDQAAGHATLVDLCLAGESLLHPGVFEALDHLARRGVGAYLQTSGNPVEGDTARRLLDCGLDTLSFSIDGATAATYAAIRIGGDLSRVERNLERFLELRARAGGGPRVIVQLIVQRSNHDEIERFRARWQASGVDAVRLKPLGINRGHASRIGDRVVAGPAEPAVAPPCIRAWRGLAVYWDGRVVPCCYDFDGCEPLGDLNHQRLVDVWRGAELARLRRRMAAGDYASIPLCHACNRKNLNVSRWVAGAGSLVGGTRLALRALPVLERLGIRP